MLTAKRNPLQDLVCCVLSDPETLRKMFDLKYPYRGDTRPHRLCCPAVQDQEGGAERAGGGFLKKVGVNIGSAPPRLDEQC